MMSETQKRDNRRKTMQATVVSDKMNKTRVVQVRWTKNEAKYQKIMRVATKYKAHDEKNETKIGDVVMIRETRPLSKDKRWVISSIISKAKQEDKS